MIFKRLFFLQDPEKVHDRFTRFARLMGHRTLIQKVTRFCFLFKSPVLKQTIHGIEFANPVGLSAGFDKDGHFLSILPDVGFGFTQLGSVTRCPYEGNPKPRLIRFKKSSAIGVYYGLKNDGVEVIAKRLKRHKKRIPVSVSVAKTNCPATAKTNEAIDDYLETLKHLEGQGGADFYTLNISCPNTFEGEPFTDPIRLRKLLSAVHSLEIKKPIYLKMPLNKTWKEFDALLKVALEFKVQGVVIANLQKDYKDPSIKEQIDKSFKGGISGKPTQKKSDQLISRTYKAYGDRLVIIGVGGIFSVEDAWQKIRKGAHLVQLITGMIFEGPQLIGELNRGIAKKLKEEGFASIEEAVGSAHR